VITVEGAISDLEIIEKDTTITPDVKVIRALKVVVKFLSTMRSNQLLTNEDKVRIKKAKEDREPKVK
jgi:hypothetical protein